MRKGFNRLLGLIVAMIFLTGCTAGTTTKQKEDSASQVIRLMSMTELTSLDPAAMLDFPDAIIQTATFEGLYLLDEKDEVQPGVAVDLPEISSDGKTYRFRLRENAQWSNGDPVTANDFEYAWKRMIDPENAFQYSFLMNGLIENAEEIARGDQSADTLGVEAKDDYTLEVRLTQPAPYFTSLMVFPIFFPQNQSVVEKFGQEYGTASDKIVYNGPFVVKNWQQTEMN